MTLTTTQIYEERTQVTYSQVNINDSNGNVDVVVGTTQALTGSSGVTNLLTLSASNPNIVAGMVVTGTNIPSGTTVVSVVGTILTISQNTTGNAGSLTFALTGKVIRVWRFDLYIASGSLTFNSISSTPTTTPLYGPVTILAPVRDTQPVRIPWMQTLPGDKLNIALGGAAQLSGTVLVSVETPSP